MGNKNTPLKDVNSVRWASVCLFPDDYQGRHESSAHERKNLPGRWILNIIPLSCSVGAAASDWGEARCSGLEVRRSAG